MKMLLQLTCKSPTRHSPPCASALGSCTLIIQNSINVVEVPSDASPRTGDQTANGRMSIRMKKKQQKKGMVGLQLAIRWDENEVDSRRLPGL